MIDDLLDDIRSCSPIPTSCMGHPTTPMTGRDSTSLRPDAWYDLLCEVRVETLFKNGCRKKPRLAETDGRPRGCPT